MQHQPRPNQSGFFSPDSAATQSATERGNAFAGDPPDHRAKTMANQSTLNLTITFHVDTDDLAAAGITQDTIQRRMIDQLEVDYRDLMVSLTGISKDKMNSYLTDASFIPGPNSIHHFRESAALWAERQVDSGGMSIRALCNMLAAFATQPAGGCVAELLARMLEDEEESGEQEISETAAVERAPEASGMRVGPAGLECARPDEDVNLMATISSQTIGIRTAFMATFHGVIGAHGGTGQTGPFRALWPTAGKLNRCDFIEARDRAMSIAAQLLVLRFTNVERQFFLGLVENAGWVEPPID